MGVQAGEVEMFPILSKVWVELLFHHHMCLHFIDQHVTVTLSTSLLEKMAAMEVFHVVIFLRGQWEEADNRNVGKTFRMKLLKANSAEQGSKVTLR